MGLTQQMQTAVSSPPAPTFDLDHLIHQARVRKGRRRAVRVIGGTVAAGLVLGTGLAGYVAIRPPQRTALNGPVWSTPSGPWLTAERLTGALAGLPPGLHLPADRRTRFQTVYGQDGLELPDYFIAQWEFDGVRVTAVVRREAPPTPGVDACAGHANCVGEQDETGMTYTTTEVNPDDGSLRVASVVYRRFDGVLVNVGAMVNVGATGPSGLPDGIVADLRTAARDPALTL